MTIIRINLKIRNIVLFLFLISAVNANSLESNIKTIKIAYYQDYPPLSYTENNKINGIFIDIAELILGKKMGYKVIQEGFPWERAQEMVKKGEFDAHITLFNKKRDEFLFFQKNTSYEASLGYAYSIKSPKLKEIENIKSIDDLKKIRLIDYIGNAWTKENLYIDEKSRENVYFLPSLINTLKMLNANRADVFLGAHEINIKYIIKKELLDNIKIKKIAFIKQNKSLFKLCIRKNFPNAQKILDEYDRKIEVAIKNGEIDKILMKKDYNLK